MSFRITLKTLSSDSDSTTSIGPQRDGRYTRWSTSTHQMTTSELDTHIAGHDTSSEALWISSVGLVSSSVSLSTSSVALGSAVRSPPISGTAPLLTTTYGSNASYVHAAGTAGTSWNLIVTATPTQPSFQEAHSSRASKTHFENRMASAKGALQRVASLSNSNGGLSVSLMRRVVVAAVTSVALYGSEIWWRAQQDRVNKLQLLLNRQARAITGLLRSTPLVFLRDQACLPHARDLLGQRQTRYAIRALSADGDRPTHQLLPASFRLGELYGYEETAVQPSSIGWTRLEKTNRLFGSRLAQQVIKHIKYDVKHGSDLPCRREMPDPAPVIRMHEYPRIPVRMLPNHPQ